MTTKTQYMKNTKGDILDNITHIYSEHGHFEENGVYAGTHIAFGSDVDQSNFIEVIDENVTNEFSYELPDIIIEEDGDNNEG